MPLARGRTEVVHIDRAKVEHHVFVLQGDVVVPLLLLLVTIALGIRGARFVYIGGLVRG